MRRPIETLAEGLGHPEGPDILPDGRIVMVETYTSKIIAWSAERGIHDYADCGGGPNACMLGSDGAVYITQNGGTVGAWKADVMNVPVHPEGVAGRDGWRPSSRTSTASPLQAPNDLTFGPDGRLYFTDPADYLPNDRRPGRVFALDPDGTASCLEELPDAYPNGIVAEPDGSIVWVESYDRGVYRKRPGAPVRADRTSCPRATSPTASRSTPTATCGSPRSCPAASTSCARTARSRTSWRPAACHSTACSTRAT